LWH
jgi:26S proteasome regulatory subunit N9